MRAALLQLKQVVVDRGVPFSNVHIFGEDFDSDELTEDDYKAWETPLRELV